MQKTSAGIIFSPSDLNHFLECEHLVRLDLEQEPGRVGAARDAHAELLAAKGSAHEQAWLTRLRAGGRSVETIDSPASDRDWDRDAERTLDAMRRGVDLIYQGVFADGGWHGVSDFLVRVERPSRFGSWSYEAWDTKLARRTRPYFVLQLCFYTEQLARAQGVAPEAMCIVLGTGEHDRLRYRDFEAYYRSVRRRFLEFIAGERATYPYPVGHCGLCEYRPWCTERWTRDDHLSQVAGIRRDQVERLHEAGVDTVAALARLEDTTQVGIGPPALDRIRHQARLQSEYRRTGLHRYELLPLDERTGFRLMPEPSPGDVFFDMEGDPYFSPERGLEYLFGVMTIDGPAPEFRAFQALNRAEEKAAFEAFIDLMHERLRRWPAMHVYHYAPYEPAALKRLMSEHATREDALDELLRREVFVDLYHVVRQSLRISHASYSIKKVRTFFMTGAGQGAVSDGADSILEFERWRMTGDPAILRAITDYNREDCESTVRLRDWLLDRKAEAERAAGVAVPWKPVETPVVSPSRTEEDALVSARRERLEAMGTSWATLLSQLLGYHRREAKPAYWAYFDRRKKSLDDLLDDTEAIAHLRPAADVQPEPSARSLVHTLEFPPQEFKLAAGHQVDDPFRQTAAGTIVWIDSARGRLGLKRGARRADEGLPAAIVTGKPLDNSTQRKAIGRVADAVIAGRSDYRAIRDLLARERPRVRGRAAGEPLQTLNLDEQRSLVAGLDASYLFVQGPPGSGKTWTGARLIVSLMAAGHRVGVAANSHKAINNLLAEVERVARAEGVTFNGFKKCTDEDDELDGEQIRNTTSNEECESSDASLLAGTSWLFAREGMDSRLDYLFIDEAGQVSLADTVAMAAAARNLVLLGDPQQLPHVRQGVHPGTSGCSVLEHLLEDAATVPEDRGLFLAHTWRMHPGVCEFVSDLAYDGRLSSAAPCARQRIDSPGMSGTGLRYIPVAHTGNAQQSREEAEALAQAVRSLLDGGTFTSGDGRVRPLEPADILVVAPYNMQVRCLAEALPEGVDAGTVDKFQGREAPIVFFSMASSTGADVPRGLEFLFSRNRFNVAISRARAMAVLVSSPHLMDVRCRTVEQMRLVNAVCRFVERASPGGD